MNFEPISLVGNPYIRFISPMYKMLVPTLPLIHITVYSTVYAVNIYVQYRGRNSIYILISPPHFLTYRPYEGFLTFDFQHFFTCYATVFSTLFYTCGSDSINIYNIRTYWSLNISASVQFIHVYMQYNVSVLSNCDYLLSERPNLKNVSKRLEL